MPSHLNRGRRRRPFSLTLKTPSNKMQCLTSTRSGYKFKGQGSSAAVSRVCAGRNPECQFSKRKQPLRKTASASLRITNPIKGKAKPKILLGSKSMQRKINSRRSHVLPATQKNNVLAMLTPDRRPMLSITTPERILTYIRV